MKAVVASKLLGRQRFRGRPRLQKAETPRSEVRERHFGHHAHGEMLATNHDVVHRRLEILLVERGEDPNGILARKVRRRENLARVAGRDACPFQQGGDVLDGGALGNRRFH